MKILKIKVKLVDGPAGSAIYYYPVDYADLNIIAYSHSEVYEGGVRFLYCLAIAKDSFTSDLPESIIAEISKDEANRLGQEWKPPVMKILNQKLVDDIITRLKNGIPLTWMEINALDPRSPEIGLNYSKQFDVEEYL